MMVPAVYTAGNGQAQQAANGGRILLAQGPGWAFGLLQASASHHVELDPAGPTAEELGEVVGQSQ
ncbi:hypothetical protein ColKHC_02500 [Colletotrichum higginsianum]|nr:hypothetical protein ColKHC_02500 [Colletotrichum higginsianum]